MATTKVAKNIEKAIRKIAKVIYVTTQKETKGQ